LRGVDHAIDISRQIYLRRKQVSPSDGATCWPADKVVLRWVALGEADLHGLEVIGNNWAST